MNIPQTNPKASYLAHKEEVDTAIAETLGSGRYVLGEQVSAFEKEFASFIGAAQCVGVGSGTDALAIALRACDIGRGDAVLTVSHTAVATVAAIELVGAVPVLVDIDPVTFTMDPNHLAHTIREYNASSGQETRAQLKAVVPVHLYGHPADLPAILEIADQNGLRVIEDCAQSHGASLNNRKTGTWGDLAAFSFYPTKNLGALGDGGAVVTSKNDVAARVRSLREYGWIERQVSTEAGVNSRLDELQAAILRVKLRYLDRENSRRRELADRYSNLLSSVPIGLPEVRPSATHVYHQYVVRSARRDSLRSHLQRGNISTAIHYPLPIHLQPAYQGRLGQRGSLPHTEAASREILSLPMCAHLKDEEVEYVGTSIMEWNNTGGS